MTQRRYDTAAVAGVNRVERIIPTAPQTIHANFAVPALQALAIAVAAICGVAGIVKYADSGKWAWVLLAIGGGVFGLAFVLFAEIVRQHQVARETIETTQPVQPATQMPTLLEPLKPQPEIVLLNPNQGQQALAVEAQSTTLERWKDFVRACALPHGTASRRWKKLREYDEWKADLLEAGWAQAEGDWPTAPWRLAAEPEEIIAALQAPPPPHSR